MLTRIFVLCVAFFSAGAMARCRPGMPCGGFNSMPQFSGGCRPGMSCGGPAAMGGGSSGACRYGQNQNILICPDGTLARGTDGVFRRVDSATTAAPASGLGVEIQNNGGNGVSAAPAPGLVASSSAVAPATGLRSFGSPNSVEPRVPCRFEQGDRFLVCSEGTYERGRNGVYVQTRASQTFSAPAASVRSSGTPAAVASLTSPGSHSGPATTGAAPVLQAPRPIVQSAPPVRNEVQLKKTPQVADVPSALSSSSLPSSDPVDSVELALLGMTKGPDHKQEIRGQNVQRLDEDSFVICTDDSCAQAMTLAQVKLKLNSPVIDPEEERPRGRWLAGLGFPIPKGGKLTQSAEAALPPASPFLRVAHNVAELNGAIAANKNKYVVVTYSDPDNCVACRALEGKPRNGEQPLPKGQQLDGLAARLAGKASFIAVDLDQLGSQLFARFRADTNVSTDSQLPNIPFSILYERNAEGVLVPVMKDNRPVATEGAAALTSLLSQHGL